METTRSNRSRVQIIEIKGDNKIVIGSVKCHIQPSWKIDQLVKDIKLFIEKTSATIIQHMYREVTRVIDWMARMGHTSP